MKLELLDIENFITKNNVKPITSSKIYSGGGRSQIDPKGPFSEEIFGRLGTPQRRKTFGYIDLKTKIIHPEAYPILTSLDTDLTKLIIGKTNYIIGDKGELIQARSNTEGDTGVLFFIRNFDKINFDLFSNKKPKEVEFIKNNKEKILISKYLLLPAGVRDIQISQKSGKSVIQFSELTETYYDRLIKQTNTIFGDIELMPEEVLNPIVKEIQRTLLEINEWIKNRMKGKHGLIRGGMLKKVTDYSGRMVIAPDPKLKLGFCGVPWQIALKLYEPFTINKILFKDKLALPLIQNYLNTEENIDVNTMYRFISKINDAPQTVDTQLKEYLVGVAKEITNDKVLLYKRDPSENRDF